MSRCICLVAVLAAAPAHAEPTNHVALEGFGTMGGSTSFNEGVDPRLGIGLDLRASIGPFVVGALGDTDLSTSGSERHLGVLAGADLASWQMLGETAHFEVLAEAGQHFFKNLGDGFLQMPVAGDASAELPYFGLRTGVFAVAKNGVFGGLWASVRADRGTKSVDVPVSTPCWLFCSSPTSISSEHFDLGGRELGFLITAGIQR